MSLKLKFILADYYKTLDKELHFYINGEYWCWDSLKLISFYENTRCVIEYLIKEVIVYDN